MMSDYSNRELEKQEKLYSCSHCFAQPGERCVNKRGKVICIAHAGRDPGGFVVGPEMEVRQLKEELNNEKLVSDRLRKSWREDTAAVQKELEIEKINHAKTAKLFVDMKTYAEHLEIKLEEFVSYWGVSSGIETQKLLDDLIEKFDLFKDKEKK